MSNKVMLDGNQAAAKIAFACSEVAAIYPITPSSPMGEWNDEWAAKGQKNLWGTIPHIAELQSEGGASGAVHGALTTGALTTTFTASQGLLLMIPNMYKIAGELTACVFHVSARSLACQGLSIFGDHSDVMACRQTGFAMLASNSVQEVMDIALIAHAATLESRIPFMHFFDGFRTSHEVQKIDDIEQETIRAMIDDDLVIAHRARGLDPEKPSIRGTAQNPDVFFQGRETVNKYYDATPAIVQKAMDKFGKLTGRNYKLFDYVGAEDAEHIIVIMGSAAETTHETVSQMTAAGEKVGVIKVRLYRPFATKQFALTLPKTVKTISVLDRTKEPGSIGEPLYNDVRTAIGEVMQNKSVDIKSWIPVYGGRYGLGSKEFTPANVKAVFKNAASETPKNNFTVNIIDDVTNLSIETPTDFFLDAKGRTECMFYGLGSDGTVGANKNSIKIIGTDTDNYAQGYFVYDSKKAGAITVSHLRFGPNLIRSPYLCTKPDFVACHQFSFLEKYDMLSTIKDEGTFLLATPFDADQVWDNVPDEVAEQIIAKKLKLYIVNAQKLDNELKLGGRINTVMQTAFFKISGIIPADEAIAALKAAAKKSYGKKGDAIVQMNWTAIDAAANAVVQVNYPDAPAGKTKKPSVVSEKAPAFVQNVTAEIMAQRGDKLPVSAIPEDGTWPTATTQWEKRNIAHEIPAWDPNTCIQCMQCSLVCPHAAIRGKVYDPAELDDAPETFKSADVKGLLAKSYSGMKYTIQCAPEDCTGCGLCVARCPAKNKEVEGRKAINMEEQIPLRTEEVKNWDFFLNLPETDFSKVNPVSIQGSQLKRPLFEFSGACAGCGETPYVKLLTQLVGDRLLIANATGCTSIYGGNLPTTPYCTREDGRGPAWSNSLFEDNAEFGFGMRLTADKMQEYAFEMLECITQNDKAPDGLKTLAKQIIDVDQKTENGIKEVRKLVAELKASLTEANCPVDCKECTSMSKNLLSVADYIINKSVWILGGDGWAYDIGYGGLDHVLASGRNIKIMVVDTEVYSNTGGQASKSTPMGAIAKFAASGKPQMKKNLGAISMTYKNIYVAQISMGANPAAAVKAIAEAEAYDGPAIVIAYSHCIAHGINMVDGLDQQKIAVQSGHFPLYRYNPELSAEGKNPLILDSKEPSISFADTAATENRFKQLSKVNPHAEEMLKKAEQGFKENFEMLKAIAALPKA
ncbi:MAG: pyruvate:ferredoxin (flavodoxin) oxidoreductase [Kiritimatiellae bacterium]|jgi:pyruvate-ferredoxin/flavodoxin oxidoreductase|nr:pyruvate:ferredoxin (flavodoxin) oxidoreductase [Kiritimatiellia bacterium]